MTPSDTTNTPQDNSAETEAPAATDTPAVDTAAPTAPVETVSIFQKVEDAVVADAKDVVAELKSFWTNEAEPILSATLQYIEDNGGADLLKIAENAFTAAMNGLETGSSVQDVTAAVVGTVIDEGKSAGIAIAQGAASLAVSLVAAKANVAQG